MVPNSILKSTQDYLRSNCMFVNEAWLTSCLEYVTSEEQNIETIQNIVKEQWLLNDLRQICPGCLPTNLRSQEKTTLQGAFWLQINAVIDVGKPAYQQYLELQKVNTENIEATKMHDQKVTSHRLLKLYMTDGVQDVIGIEYKPIKILYPGIIPGIKVLIKGPVDCRRGSLLLTEKNIELLDGEVGDLLIINSQLASVERKLGLPVTLEQPTSAPEITTTQHTITLNTEVGNTNSTEDSEFGQIGDIDFNQLDMIERQYLGTATKRLSEDAVLPPEKKPKPGLAYETNNNAGNTFTDNRANEFPSEDDFPSNDLHDDHLDITPEDFQDDFDNDFGVTENGNAVEVPNIVRSNEIDCIDTINNYRGDKNRTFKVKAKILTLLSKLSVYRNSWHLQCTLDDGSGTIGVDFANEVLSELVGYTPEKMYELKKQITKRPDIQKQIMEALKNVKEKLQTIHCVMEIDIKEKPTVVRLVT